MVFELLLVAMIYGLWAGWTDISAIYSHEPIVDVSLNDIALIGFIGFYGLRIAMFIAMARGLRMPQRVEWIVAIVPATIAVVCIFLSGPIERVYIAANGYHACGSHIDSGTRSSLYTFAAESVRCPDRAKAGDF